MGATGRRVAVAGVLNNISTSHQAFFNNGGLGIVIGDGQLPHPGSAFRADQLQPGLHYAEHRVLAIGLAQDQLTFKLI